MSEVNVVLFGDTRAGKTSFVNTISNRRDWQRVGDASGESTTIDVSECTTQLNGKTLHVYDTPGMNDSRLRLSNRNIKEKIEYHVASSSATTLDAIIVFESLQGEAVSLRRNLATVLDIFGAQAKSSVVVLLTKESTSPSRTQHIQDLCRELQLPFVLWENNYKDAYGGQWVTIDNIKLDRQRTNLTNTIGQAKKYEMTRLKALESEIKAEATRRQNNEAPTYDTVSCQVKVQYLEPETRAVKKYRQVVKERWKRGGFMRAVLAEKESYVEVEPYTENKTIYHPRTRTETQTKQVQRPKKGIDYYTQIVKKEKLQQLKQALSQN